MLDPELFDKLASQPEKNAPDVNLALAEEGRGAVLLSLVRSGATAGDALAVIASRIEREGPRLEEAEEDDDTSPEEDALPLLEQLDSLLIAHRHAPAAVRDAVLERHSDHPFYVLAAASHPQATLAAVERAVSWPGRFPVLDRLWVALIPPRALPPLVAEEWSQDDDSRRRETVARLAREPSLLDTLSRDADRGVRRAVASNPVATTQRASLARADPAAEVRARARTKIGEHQASASVDSARFAAALRAMESGGVLAPDVAAALGDSLSELDEEGAILAARVLPTVRLLELVKQSASAGPTPASIGLAAGLALREPRECGGEAGLRELAVDAAKALSGASEQYGVLTGKARLAAWVSDGLACGRTLDSSDLVDGLCAGGIGGDGPILARGVAGGADLLHSLCHAAKSANKVPPALLGIAWRSDDIDDDTVLALAKRLAKAKRRGRDLADDELDLDPSRRSVELLEKVVLAVNGRVTVSARSALTVVALDARRVRYVLTAMPQWRGRLSGTMLARVLRHNAGALSAARSEARARGSLRKGWTERIMSDVEMAVALGVGHFTAQAVVERVMSGRHKPQDGASFACGAEARAVLEGPSSIKPLLRWAAQQRTDSGVALAVWLLLETHDRARVPSMIASAIDTHAARSNVVAETTSGALACLERRQPGRLEQVHPQTPRGKATLASALARAYRAIGGLRDER
jgi:hypothetical protein